MKTTLVICRSVSKLAYTFEIDLPHKLLQNKIKVVQNAIFIACVTFFINPFIVLRMPQM